MKNRLVFFLAVVALFFAPMTTQAGFLVKKHTAVQAAATATTTDAAAEMSVASYTNSQLFSSFREAQSPSGTFVNMLYRGQISSIAFVFGLIGLLLPIFAIGAITFGFLGFSNRKFRKKGFGIAAFFLGLITIFAMAFAGYSPLPIF